MRKMVLMASQSGVSGTGTVEGIEDVTGYGLNFVGGCGLNFVEGIVDLVGEDGVFSLGRVYDLFTGNREG
ncbi:hypothetical protein TorRG33x02_316850 [Trema orientale]|uniref:Uncharacterized protein n=1 Tax=Trema orientale TaxID=63057 RepID=A0A2P5BLF6_TREOI|nr:hypothetical protein TorRG33x02_316850 [Trema orientale]